MNFWRRRRNRAVAGVLLLLLAFGGYRYAAPRWVLKRYRADLQAQGERLTIDACQPELRPKAVAAGAEFLGLAQRLPAANTGLGSELPVAMLAVVPGKALVGWAQPMVPLRLARQKATNRWEDLALILDRQSNTLAGLVNLSQQPRLQWSLNYHQNYSLLLPHLAPQKRAAQWLVAAAQLDLRRQQPAAAADRLVGLLGLARALQPEPLLISQLVRIALGGIAFSGTWALLQAEGLADADLARLQSAWAEQEFLEPMVSAFEMERALGLDMFSQCRASAAKLAEMGSLVSTGTGAGTGSGLALPSSIGEWPGYCVEFVGRAASGTAQGLRVLLWRMWWAPEDEHHYLRETTRHLVPARDALRNAGSLPLALARTEAEEQEDLWPLHGVNAALRLRHLLSSMLLSPTDKTLLKVALMHNQRDMAVAALALHRYRLREGHWPPTLEAIPPELLPFAPRDAFDAQPLRYQVRTNGTFLLYSVGQNGVDEGGDPTPRDPKSSAVGMTQGRDLVWPWPATEAELRAAQAKAR